jgi:hypothetical protein
MADALELYLLGVGTPPQGVAFARCGDDSAIDVLSCAQLDELRKFRDRLEQAAYGREARPTASELTEFGHALFAFAIQSGVDAVYQRLPLEPIGIQILSNHADIQALPWEYLQEPGRPSGPDNRRLPVRVVPTVRVPAPPPRPRTAEKKLRVLFAYADPEDQDGVAWSDVQQSMERAFLSRAKDRYGIWVVEGASEQSLMDALVERDYDIFHFSGHGRITPEGRGELVLRDFKTRQTQPLSAERLAAMLSGRSPQLVVLSSCNMGNGDFTKGFAVMARTLVEQGVPAVVANQFPVNNSVAATFASGFYAGLLRTGDLDIAVGDGRQAIASQPAMGTQAAFDWGIPCLYRHIGAAEIFKHLVSS